MKIFPETPEITPEDRERLRPHIDNLKVTLVWLATNPGVDDLKRAVQLDVERAYHHHNPLRTIQRGVLTKLLKRIQQCEWSAIDAAILKVLRP